MKKTNLYVPYKRYIQVLLLGRLTPQQIAEDLTINELVLPTASIMNKIRDEILLQDSEFLDNPALSRVPSEELLDAMQLKEGYATKFEDIYGPTYGMPGAIKMHQDFHLRRALEALALGKLAPEDIELLTNGKYDIAYNSEDFKCFFHYFFDINDWGLQEKKEYISKLTGYDNDTIRIFKEALKGDKPKLLWELGFSPGLTIEQMVRDMSEDAYYNFKKNIRVDTEAAYKWASIFDKMASRADKIESDTEQQKNMYEEMVFKIKKTDVLVDIQEAKDISTDIPDLELLKAKSMDLDSLPKDDILSVDDLENDSVYEQ